MGTFNTCTFWLVEALTRAARLNEARLTLEQMMGFANRPGLFSEQQGPRTEARELSAARRVATLRQAGERK